MNPEDQTPNVPPTGEPNVPPNPLADPAQASPPADPPVTPPVDGGTPPAQEPPAEPPASNEGNDPPLRAVPETADGYKLPEGVPTELGAWAKSNDMTQEQLDASYQKFGEVIEGSKMAERNAIRAAGEAHVTNWGEKKAYNTNIIKRALPAIDPEGALTKVLNESGMINHPVVLDALLNVGNSMKEGGFLKGAIARPPGQKTAAQALYGDNHPSAE